MLHELNQFEREQIEPLIDTPEKTHRLPAVSVEKLEESVGDNEQLREVFETMLQSCLEYTITVARYQRLAKRDGEIGEGISDEWREVDKVRGIVHNATIDNINIFSRQLGINNIDNSWIEGVSQNRASYGRFALTLTLSRIDD